MSIVQSALEDIDDKYWPGYCGPIEGLARHYNLEDEIAREKKENEEAFNNGIDVLEPFWRAKRDLLKEESRADMLDYMEEWTRAGGYDPTPTLFMNGFGRFYSKKIQDRMMNEVFTPTKIDEIESYNSKIREEIEKKRPQFVRKGQIPRKVFDFTL